MFSKENTMKVLAAVVLIMSVGCVSFGDLTPEQQYSVARIEFNSLFEAYLDAYDAADIETQTKWKEEVDPRINEAILALDLWGLYQDSGGDIYEAQKAFLTAKNKLLELLAPIIVKE